MKRDNPALAVNCVSPQGDDVFAHQVGEATDESPASDSSPGKFRVLEGTSPESAQIRAYVHARVKKTYAGWDDEFDRSFDHHATWFCLSYGGAYLATCKLIFKTVAGETIKLPMELADRNPYVAMSGDAIEGSGLTFVHREHLFVLMYHMGRWMKRHQCGRITSIVDTRNDALQRIYQRALGFQLDSHGVLSFRNFCHKDSGDPVDWQVIALEPAFFWAEANYTKLALRGARLFGNSERT